MTCNDNLIHVCWMFQYATVHYINFKEKEEKHVSLFLAKKRERT